jgi:hypothetical protein
VIVTALGAATEVHSQVEWRQWSQADRLRVREESYSCNAANTQACGDVYVCRRGKSRCIPVLHHQPFGVLTYKKAGEECVKASGIPYTIIRPGRLSEGPFTGKGVACNGWDEDCTTWQICWSTARACAGLNDRVLRATTGTLKGVNISNHDDLSGQAARSMVAELLAQAFLIDELKNRVVAMESTSEEGPGTDTDKWRALIPVP